MIKTKLIIVLVLFLVWGVGLWQFTTLIPDAPATDTTHTDAIVVLTGGGLRLERGFQLLMEGRAPRMFISGVEDGLTVATLLDKKEYHAFAGKVPVENITLGYKARSTKGNASEIAEWAGREHIKSIRLVSGNYHIPRSLFEIHQAAPDLTIIPEPVFPQYFEGNQWWMNKKSIRLVISEYHKYMINLVMSR
jgi:uncharacterized SAM-binding protein YcdF (DUF218 family)